jgi:hypothetical protein
VSHWGNVESELDDATLAELGRVVLAAAYLESVVYVICRIIRPRHGDADDWPIGARIREALDDLNECPADDRRAAAEAWLVEAAACFELRNAVLHSWPVVFSTELSGIVERSDESRPAMRGLSHTPRRNPGETITTELTVDGLRPIWQRIDAARVGWFEHGGEWASNPPGESYLRPTD